MLQTNSEGGVALLRLGDRVNRRIGSIDVAANSNGFIDVAMFAEGIPFHVVTSLGDGTADFLARVTISGVRLSWKYEGLGYGEPQPSRISYGVY